ncbi:Ig-like domain-containing protein, partial [Enterobacteriaceae bacterium H11S18]|uniref:Ig-like domain-containing protein n=1 Tax=Dryocola clanedunensis TaxID=2925396 RepID=UPI0022F06321
MQQLFLSRQGNALQIHTEQAAMPAAIIPDYYSTAAMLTVPTENNQLMALSTELVQEEASPVQTFAASVDIPWSDSPVPVTVSDDDGNTISEGGTTTDLTPTLSGFIDHGAGTVLTIYANGGRPLGTTVVDQDGNWSFTPAAGDLQTDSSYVFQVLMKNPGGGSIIIALPYTIAETAEATAPDDLPNTGDIGAFDITLVDDNGPNQGEVGNHGVTDDLTPTLEGTVLHGAGLTLQIYANSLYLGTTMVDSNGHWSFEIANLDGILGRDTVHVSELQDNSQFTIQVLAVNPGGQEALVSLPFIFSTGFDYNVPTITSVTDDAGIFTGELTEAQPTDDTTPTFTGTSDPGVTVNVYDGNTLLGSAVASADGTWTFTPSTPLSGDGQHLISVTATNSTDETAHSDQFDVNLDTVCETPVITGVIDDTGIQQGNVDNGGKTDDLQPSLTGTGEAGSTVTLTMYSAAEDISVVLGTVVVGADGTWQFQLSDSQSLALGDNVFHITAVDVAGNQAAGSDYTVIAVDTNQDDTTVPDPATDITLTDNVKGGVVGEVDNGGLTNDSSAVLSGNATAGDTVIISDNGAVIGSVVAAADGSWSFKPTTAFTDGEHAFTAVVENPNNGLQSDPSAEFDVTVDTVVAPPVITGAYDDVGVQQGFVANGGKTDDLHITFEGTAEANALVYIRQRGSAGNFIYTLGSTVADADGHWTFENTSGIHGQYQNTKHDFWADQVDPAGNASARSNIYVLENVTGDRDDTSTPDTSTNQVLIDDVGPIQGEIHENDITDDNQPTMNGDAAAGSIVIISDNGSVIGSVTTAADGTWSFTPANALADGEHSFSTVVKNPNNGNLSDESTAIDFTVDTAVPTVSIDSVVDDVDPVTGDVANNGYTNDATPTLNGEATANAIVNIYDG